MSDSVIAWTIQSMEFSRPEYWSGQSFPFPGDLTKHRSPALQVGSLPTEPQGKPRNTGVGSLPLQALNMSLQHPRAGITRKCSKPAFFAPLPIVVVPDKRWRAQRASSLLAFLLRLLIQQLKGPGCKGLTAHSTQKRVQGEKGRKRKGVEPTSL